MPNFSNYGTNVTVSAPGENIISTLWQNSTGPTNPTYAGMSGTSMASPHVAGIVSLMLSINPALTFDQVKAILQTSANHFFTGTWCASNPNNCGAGIVNAQAAVLAAKNNNVIYPTATATSTPIPPTATRTSTKTNTPVTPTSTRTSTRTNTPVTPSATRTNTRTNTLITPTATRTNTKTSTPITPSATWTKTRTNTPITPTSTQTPSKTSTPITPTATKTVTRTFTLVPPTITRTPTRTNTPGPPTATNKP